MGPGVSLPGASTERKQGSRGHLGPLLLVCLHPWTPPQGARGVPELKEEVLHQFRKFRSSPAGFGAGTEHLAGRDGSTLGSPESGPRHLEGAVTALRETCGDQVVRPPGHPSKTIPIDPRRLAKGFGNRL